MKTCPICGIQVADADTFCSACGNQLEPTVQNAPDAAPLEKAASNETDAAKLEMPEPPHTLYKEPVTQPAAPQQPEASQAAYVPAYAPLHNNDPVSMGEWILNLIVLNVPIVGFIMTFVWGFGTSAKPSLRNFARAMLIFKVILFVLVVLLFILLSVLWLSNPHFYYEYGGY